MQPPPPPYAPLPQGPGTGLALYVDQQSGVAIPQGTEIASVGRRIGAYFLAIPLVIVTLVIGYVVWGLIAWSKGTTPALQVLGMRCWYPERQEVPGFGRMALREIIGRFVDGILGPITQVISFVLFVTRADRKSLHDLVASTVVLRDPNGMLKR